MAERDHGALSEVGQGRRPTGLEGAGTLGKTGGSGRWKGQGGKCTCLAAYGTKQKNDGESEGWTEKRTGLRNRMGGEGGGGRTGSGGRALKWAGGVQVWKRGSAKGKRTSLDGALGRKDVGENDAELVRAQGGMT